MGESNIWREAAAGKINQVINLSRTVGIDVVDQWGWTPLHWACKKNHPLLVAELLRSRANPSILDLEGNTPLDIAMIEEYHECVSCLGRQYTYLQSDLDAANNRDQRDEELIQEITRQIASRRNS